MFAPTTARNELLRVEDNKYYRVDEGGDHREGVPADHDIEPTDRAPETSRTLHDRQVRVHAVAALLGLLSFSILASLDGFTDSPRLVIQLVGGVLTCLFSLAVVAVHALRVTTSSLSRSLEIGAAVLVTVLNFASGALAVWFCVGDGESELAYCSIASEVRTKLISSFTIHFVAGVLLAIAAVLTSPLAREEAIARGDDESTRRTPLAVRGVSTVIATLTSIAAGATLIIGDGFGVLEFDLLTIASFFAGAYGLLMSIAHLSYVSTRVIPRAVEVLWGLLSVAMLVAAAGAAIASIVSNDFGSVAVYAGIACAFASSIAFFVAVVTSHRLVRIDLAIVRSLVNARLSGAPGRERHARHSSALFQLAASASSLIAFALVAQLEWFTDYPYLTANVAIGAILFVVHLAAFAAHVLRVSTSKFSLDAEVRGSLLAALAALGSGAGGIWFLEDELYEPFLATSIAFLGLSALCSTIAANHADALRGGPDATPLY